MEANKNGSTRCLAFAVCNRREWGDAACNGSSARTCHVHGVCPAWRADTERAARRSRDHFSSTISLGGCICLRTPGNTLRSIGPCVSCVRTTRLRPTRKHLRPGCQVGRLGFRIAKVAGIDIYVHGTLVLFLVCLLPTLIWINFPRPCNRTSGAPEPSTDQVIVLP